jgi:hypothetical protein
MNIPRIPLILFFAFLTGCGGSMTNSTTARQLTALTVSPSSATVQNGTSKQVQFTANGSYNMAPMTGMPQVMWSIGMPFASAPVPAGVTISSSGLAQCTTFTGTVMISATAPMNPMMSMSQMSMMTQNVTGNAQLTCP